MAEVEVHRKPPTAIVKDEGRGSDDAHLLAFVDPNQYSEAFLLADWSIVEEIKELVGLARQTDNKRLKLAAIRYLHKLAVESLLISGRIAKITATHRDGDRRINMEISRVQGAALEAQDGFNEFVTSKPRTKEITNDQTAQAGVHKPPKTIEEDPADEEAPITVSSSVVDSDRGTVESDGSVPIVRRDSDNDSESHGGRSERSADDSGGDPE